MKDCVTVLCLKEDHNAEKVACFQYRLTPFGSEIQIMDKCCVCGKQPRIRSGLQTRLDSCVKQA